MYCTMWTILTIAFFIFIGVGLLALEYLIFECPGEEGCVKSNSKTRRLVALMALAIAFVFYVYHRFVANPEGGMSNVRRIARINLKGL